MKLIPYMVLKINREFDSVRSVRSKASKTLRKCRIFRMLQKMNGTNNHRKHVTHSMGDSETDQSSVVRGKTARSKCSSSTWR